MSNKIILVVDDDAKIVELVKIYLKRDGYSVITAYNGTDALKTAQQNKPDLIVLDIMLPGIDGLEICRELRKASTVPIILLTARTTEEDRIKGLDLGADDYVTKPFSPKELAARIRAVFRRMPDEILEMGAEELSYEDLVINFPKHEVYLKGSQMDLTPVEFKLLGILVREPGRVFSRSQLVEKVMGYDFEGFDRTIDVHILNLRRKLEPYPSHPQYIKTVYGSGYKFNGGTD
jgi:two-component system, OmpR family, alkaline phosphatase synthesis response regulator PhoP